MPAIYHEGSWLGNATDPEVLVKDTVGWTGKNLYKTENMSGNTNVGITTTKVGGVVTLNGTTTGEYVFPTEPAGQDYYDIEAGKSYIFSTETENANIELQVYVKETSSSSWTRLAQDTTSGNELSFTMPNSFYDIWVRCLVRSGKTLTNVTIYPMLRKADITDPTYEPYHESVEEEIEQIYADNGVLGAKNLLNPTYAGGTVNGVTITTNENKTYKLNGAPSSGNMAVAIYTGTFPVGRYILNGVPDFTTYGARLHIRETAGASQVDAIDTGKGIEFAIPSATTSYSVFMYLNSGYTANDLIIKPMLRLASDPDDTYQPYAMTNRELTEKLNTKKSSATDTVGTITNNKIYKQGAYVFFVFESNALTLAVNDVIAKIPEGYRSPVDFSIRIPGDKTIRFQRSGDVVTLTAFSNENIRLSASWITA